MNRWDEVPGTMHNICVNKQRGIPQNAYKIFPIDLYIIFYRCSLWSRELWEKAHISLNEVIINFRALFSAPFHRCKGGRE
jgi:hypothetical protein